MKEEEQREDPRSISDEENTSYQQQRRLKNHGSPHRTTMPTFFEEGERYRNEEINEPETHETLSLYLEEYKAYSIEFKEKLTLQQLFKIKEESVISQNRENLQ